jgi:hypothetical protein
LGVASGRRRDTQQAATQVSFSGRVRPQLSAADESSAQVSATDLGKLRLPWKGQPALDVERRNIGVDNNLALRGLHSSLL